MVWLLFGARDPVEAAFVVSFQNSIANMSEESRRQHAVIEAGWLHARHGLKVGAGPDEIICLVNDNPRRQIVKTEVSFQRSGDLDRVGGIDRTPVRDWHDRYDFPALNELLRGYDGARPIFGSFFTSSPVLGCPEVRIADHKTGTRRR